MFFSLCIIFRQLEVPVIGKILSPKWLKVNSSAKLADWHLALKYKGRHIHTHPPSMYCWLANLGHWKHMHKYTKRVLNAHIWRCRYFSFLNCSLNISVSQMWKIIIKGTRYTKCRCGSRLNLCSPLIFKLAGRNVSKTHPSTISNHIMERSRIYSPKTWRG